jgi:hypothetical protein
MNNQVQLFTQQRSLCTRTGSAAAAILVLSGLMVLHCRAASAQGGPLPVPRITAGAAGAGIDGPLELFRSGSFSISNDPELFASPVRLDFGPVCSAGLLLSRLTTLPAGILNPPPPISFKIVTVTSMTVSGSGFSLLSPPTVPFSMFPGTFLNFNIAFSPTAIGPAAGALTVVTDDPTKPPLVIPLTATGDSPAIAAAANTLRTPTLPFGSVTTWPVTIANTTGSRCTLSVLPTISGTGGSWQVLLPASYFLNGRMISDIEIPAGGVNTDLTVKFTSSVTSRTTKAVGTLTLRSNDLARPNTNLVFGAEVVAPGMRVLIVEADGTPVPVGDDIMLKSSKSKVETHLKDVPLTTIDPPVSWKQIQFHYVTALYPAEDGNEYELRVQAGNRKQTLTFTLIPGEFKELTIKLP